MLQRSKGILIFPLSHLSQNDRWQGRAAAQISFSAERIPGRKFLGALRDSDDVTTSRTSQIQVIICMVCRPVCAAEEKVLNARTHLRYNMCSTLLFFPSFLMHILPFTLSCCFYSVFHFLLIINRLFSPCSCWSSRDCSV